MTISFPPCLYLNAKSTYDFHTQYDVLPHNDCHTLAQVLQPTCCRTHANSPSIRFHQLPTRFKTTHILPTRCLHSFPSHCSNIITNCSYLHYHLHPFQLSIMALLQSLIPTNFAKLPSKKFQRKHRQYLKNKHLASIARRADELMVEQLAQKAQKQLPLRPTHTSNGVIP